MFTQESFEKFLAEMRLEALLFVLNRREAPRHHIYTLGNYNHREFSRQVVFKHCDQSFNCSCLKFEIVGLPCGHAIHIIKVERLEETLKTSYIQDGQKLQSSMQPVHHASLLDN